ncbi:hypothetical protein [Haloferula sp. A504]|uniref:hypothetical protein n=1 Tax=Haloferula sp. A504 TaxID=3373601 RepID=UPI0031C8815A|nr:hypothetical protein [Verrucomicrobiaceae bacterium E54]
MKAIIRHACLIAGCISIAGAAEKDKPVYRDAATHDQLALELRKMQNRDPMKNREAVTGEDPSKVNRPVDLLEQSDIISFGGFATLVPKRAILSVPDNYRRYMTLDPKARIIGWADFLSRNRGWISTIEVSRIEAEGNKPLPEETSEQIAKSSNLIVATHRGGPISVLPLKQPEEPSIADQEQP